jgi:hypothetical protein
VVSVDTAACQYLGDFVSSLVGPRPMPNPWATNYVRNRAADRGATDVTVDEQPQGYVVAKAYRCR